jgi:hypothetical protein
MIHFLLFTIACIMLFGVEPVRTVFWFFVKCTFYLTLAGIAGVTWLTMRGG